MYRRRTSNRLSWTWFIAAVLTAAAAPAGVVLHGMVLDRPLFVVCGFIGAVGTAILLMVCVSRSYAEDFSTDDTSQVLPPSGSTESFGPIGRILEALRVLRTEPGLVLAWTGLLLTGSAILLSAFPSLQ